jgi:hypothetical protein
MEHTAFDSLRIGQTFESGGKFYRVCEVLRIAGTLWNVAACRVHKTKGYTFGGQHNFPFKKAVTNGND